MGGWQDTAMLWSCKQAPGQSVDDFINVMDKRASKIQASEETRRYAIINGLLPAIRRQVLQHDVKSVDDIRRWATIAEASESEINADNDMAMALKSIQINSQPSLSNDPWVV